MAYGGRGTGPADDGYPVRQLDDGYAEVLGRRLPWSRWWWSALLLLALALLLSVLPSPVLKGSGVEDCGTGFLGTGGGPDAATTSCADVRADRFVEVLTLLVLAAVLAGFGQWERSRVRSDTNGWVTFLGILVVTGLWLLIWPVTAEVGSDACGSPLLTSQAAVTERSGSRTDTDVGQCAQARSSRLARLGLVVLIALPVAVAAARSEDES